MRLQLLLALLALFSPLALAQCMNPPGTQPICITPNPVWNSTTSVYGAFEDLRVNGSEVLTAVPQSLTVTTFHATGELRIPSGPVNPGTCNAGELWFNDGDGWFYSCNGFPSNTWRKFSLYSLIQVNSDGFFSSNTGINFKDGTSPAPVHFSDDGSGGLKADMDQNPSFNNVTAALLKSPSGLPVLALGNSSSNDVNYLEMLSAPTTQTPTVQSVGADATIGQNYQTKGLFSCVQFAQGNASYPYFSACNNGNNPSVNYVSANGAATAQTPILAATGTDPNINLGYATKGTGIHIWQINGANVCRIAAAAGTVGAQFQFTAAGGTTGAVATISTVGSDTNAPIAVAPKGTGSLIVRTSQCFTAAGTSCGNTATGAIGTTKAAPGSQAFGNVTANGASGLLIFTVSTAGLSCSTAVVTNSNVVAGSGVFLMIQDYTGTPYTNGQPQVWRQDTAGSSAGSFTLHLCNDNAVNALSGTLYVYFWVLN